MFRKTSGAILCPSCGRLTNADAPACLVCGRRNPGMWGFAAPLRALFRRRSFVDMVTIACVVLYVASLVFDPRAALQPRGLFNVFSPSLDGLRALGATGAVPWRDGQWWTLFTAIYLHGGLLHILFNVLWIRQLGPAVEELYGPSRLVVIFTVAGVAGFAISNLFDYAFTIGASGSIFGLLGAMVAFGQKRGGTFGTMVLRQYGQWALLLFVLGFLMPGVNNV
ncbi:MAG: rhomboid family intramembrane serine protease, partial [Gemmatimonadales bacterium]